MEENLHTDLVPTRLPTRRANERILVQQGRDDTADADENRRDGSDEGPTEIPHLFGGLGAEVLPPLPRLERFVSLQDAAGYFELVELRRRLVRELEATGQPSRRATVLAEALRYVERAATALRPLAGIGEM